MMNSSCFWELQTCSRPNEIQEKNICFPKTFPEIATSLPEGTATASIKNFINAMKITKEEINSYKVKNDALE